MHASVHFLQDIRLFSQGIVIFFSPEEEGKATSPKVISIYCHYSREGANQMGHQRVAVKTTTTTKASINFIYVSFSGRAKVVTKMENDCLASRALVWRGQKKRKRKLHSNEMSISSLPRQRGRTEGIRAKKRNRTESRIQRWSLCGYSHSYGVGIFQG